MAKSNRDRVGEALDILAEGLSPFVEQEMKAAYQDRWLQQAAHSVSAGREAALDEDKLRDVHVLLRVMWEQWRPVFSKVLGHSERSLVSELRDVRNRWAHQESFSTDDAYRTLDSAHRLLLAVSAVDEAVKLEHLKQDLLRIRFDEQARKASKKAAVAAVEGSLLPGLKPWREVITPHQDVASGRYQQAEFAADLSQVYRQEGSEEYRNPAEFFRRTYLTDGLRSLLTLAMNRLTGTGGDPVVELQTNFGGGKTHALLSLYHLASDEDVSEMQGLGDILKECGVKSVPETRRAVLVGTALSPSQPHRVDGLEIRTIWGELAWQLGGAEGYALVAESDSAGTSPGSALRELFSRYSPCLVLMDEWVAYARQLYGKENLIGGSFDAHFSFAQALTESAHAVPGTLVVISTPASDIEIGGVGGQEALVRLKNVIGRIQSPWRPANAEESFEIVRRRLFQPVEDHVLRDAAASAFADLYRTQAAEFPSDCREAAYERRIKAAYPIHPELFDRLYEDWSSLEKFQRTRGVLRLMAAVIHTLWERQDPGMLIMPGNVPIDDSAVQFELTRYLEDSWVPVIEKDVDGPNSLPLELDRQNPNLGRLSACRRVARTLYLGSAPTLQSANQGLEDIRIKLGCVQPGESPAIFGDALRRLADNANHLYVDGRRYWFSTQPTVTRLAKDRAEQCDQDAVNGEILRRLRDESQRGDFMGVHVAPGSSSDVPDEDEVRLVVLGPEFSHSSKSAESAAKAEATDILENRGSTPRRNRNMLVFLAADRDRLVQLEESVRRYLAWKSIETESTVLNLDPFQANQAQTNRTNADDTVKQQLPETYKWALSPVQQNGEGQSGWEAISLSGAGSLAERVSKKLKNEGLLAIQYSSTLLRRELDRVPLWQGDHVGMKQVWDYYAQYLYLQRLRDSSVLVNAVQEGVVSLGWEQDAFAYAQSYDEAHDRYLGLTAGGHTSVIMDSDSLLVKPDVARRQLDEEKAVRSAAEAERVGGVDMEGEGGGTISGEETGGHGPTDVLPVEEHKSRRFHGTVSLDPLRVGRDADQIADAIIQHLTSCLGAEVEITIEIHAEIPDGAPDDVVRTVTENARTLKFDGSSGFERE